MAGPNPVRLDAQAHVGREPEPLPGPGRIGYMPSVADELPLGGSTAVVECRLADELDLDVAVEALDGAYKLVLGVVVRGRPRVWRDLVLMLERTHRQGVANDHPPVRRLPGRLEHIRARHVGDCRWVVDPERSEAEEAGLAVEQAAEDAGRVEAGNGEPVDRSVRGHERAGVAVGEERV